MKTFRILKSVAVVLMTLLIINSCDTIEQPKEAGDAGQTLLKLLPTDFNLVALNAVTTSQTGIMLEVRRDVHNEAALNSTTNAKLTFSQAALDKYNTDNEMSLIPLPATLGTISPAPGADGSINLAFGPGEFTKAILVTIPNATKFDFTKQYGFAYVLSFVDGEGKLSEGSSTEIVVQVLVKNKFDGLYEVTAKSPMVDVANAALTGYYPFIYELQTSGESSVKCLDKTVWGDYMHPILNGTSASGYGSFGLEVFFDASGKIIDVKNTWGNPPSNTRMPAIDPSGINKWNPTTRNIDFKYWMKQPSVVTAAPNIRVYFDETWTYKGSR